MQGYVQGGGGGGGVSMCRVEGEGWCRVEYMQGEGGGVVQG